MTQREISREDAQIEMIVEGIAIGNISHQPVVILMDKGGEFCLPIWIGLVEANAISVILEGVQLCSIIDTTGSSIDYIVINNLQNQTFYANIALRYNWRQVLIDARPSDAIAIALIRYERSLGEGGSASGSKGR